MYFEYILHWIAPLALEMRIIICFAQTRDCHVLFFRAQNKKIYNFISGFSDKDFFKNVESGLAQIHIFQQCSSHNSTIRGATVMRRKLLPTFDSILRVHELYPSSGL